MTVKKNSYQIRLVLLVLFSTFWLQPKAFAEVRRVNLIVDYKKVHFAGKDSQALAINDQIPGPSLHFKEGDEVHITVHNRLKEATAIHWHGILLPWQMDGVEGVS